MGLKGTGSQYTLVCGTKHVARIEKTSVGIHKIVSQQVAIPVLGEVNALEANSTVESQESGQRALLSIVSENINRCESYYSRRLDNESS
jgi:hypothetical protein